MILALGLLARLTIAYVAVYGAGFNLHERLFIALAWSPKATVQAAVGALALDLARHHQAGAQAEIYGLQVLTLAVLAIICTSPIGALAISRSGPRWLQQNREHPLTGRIDAG